jgi:PAS domain S-box-containing protein
MRSTLPIEVPPYFWTIRDKGRSAKKGLFYRDAHPERPLKVELKPLPLAWTALAFGVAATIFAWYLVGLQQDREARTEFANSANLATSVIERRMQRYVDMLYGLEALASHDTDFTRTDFYEYTSALDVGRRFPGVRAIQFIRRVPDAERERFVKKVRADRNRKPPQPDFDIRPADRHEEYWVVDFIEPVLGNEAAVGLDIRSRPAALEAAQRARDSGEPVMTGRYRLVQERESSYGLIIYLPVFGEATPRTPAARRAALQGFVNVVLRADDLFADILTERALHRLRLEVHDMGSTNGPAASPGDETRFFRSSGATASTAPGLGRWAPSHERELTLAGRRWLLSYASDPEPSTWLRPLALLTLGAGLIVSLLLHGILRAVARGRTEAIALATQATRELRTQLLFTQQLIEAIPSPVFFKDAQGRYLGCNRAFEDYVGHPRDQLVGKTVFDIAPKDLAQAYEAADRALIDKPGTQSYEASVVYARDGSRHDVLFNKATFYDTSGEIAGLVGVIVDITQRKQLEANTRESNERLRAVIQAAPLAIISRDLEGVIRMWNPAAEQMFGWREEEVLNTATEVAPEELKDEAVSLRQRAQEGESIWIEETLRMRRDGRTFDCAVSISPVYGGDGEVNGTMVTIADITPRKAAESALRESEQRLRLAMEAAQMGMWYWECDTDDFSYSEGLNVPLRTPPQRPADRLPRAAGAAASRRPRALRRHDAPCREAGHRLPGGLPRRLARRQHALDREPRAGAPGDDRAARKRVVGRGDGHHRPQARRAAHRAHGAPRRAHRACRTACCCATGIQQAIAQAHRAGSQLAVLFIDLDRFKTINDSLGPPARRPAAAVVASRILGLRARGRHRCARVGGDEFVIVIPGAAFGRRRVGRRLEDPRRARERLPPARQRPARGSLDRHQPLSGRRRRRRDAHAQRRHRDVPREGLGPRQLPVLHAAHERRGAAAAHARDGAAPRHREPRVRAALPAALRPARPLDHRLRGAAALDPTGRADGAAGGIHLGRRGVGPHRARSANG